MEARAEMVTDETEARTDERTCFAIMPISDPQDYEDGHFQHVYRDIIIPACMKAGFKPVRADEIKESNLIQLDILERFLDADMAICDLSSRNPNVLFELALRQAFDRPVALIQEEGTPPIFDIAPFRYVTYRRRLMYCEVLEDQENVAAIISKTYESYQNREGVNSIVKLLAIRRSASIPILNKDDTNSSINRLILLQLENLSERITYSNASAIVYPILDENYIQDEIEKMESLIINIEVDIKINFESSPIHLRQLEWISDRLVFLSRGSYNSASYSQILDSKISSLASHISRVKRSIHII
jgi:hypothetical protein